MPNAVITTYPPLFNGFQLQMSNLNLGIEGVYFPYFNEFEYSDTCEVAEGRGASPYPMGTTTGEYKANGSIGVQLMYRDRFLQILKTRGGGDSFMDVPFDMVMQWQLKVPPGFPQPRVFTDQALGCRITGGGITLSAGNGVVIEKYPLYIGLIIRDGTLPVTGLTL